ncbi:hypothetical protein KAR91_04695 [Candidatus Pacearchaeota archaeon]|nr:hypothetical protein [Candidatus Pacearchaeota archaeon]
MDEKLEEIIKYVKMEFEFATSKFGSYNSSHEGYAVILEELDELWDEVKLKKKSNYRMRKEAIQVAVTAIRFVYDITGTEQP